ncbi:MAG: Nif3-like dinuclear metal center hexameric protein [Clostridia bacterium]
MYGAELPPEYAADYDNPGLLAGRKNREISKVLLCLDCDRFVVDEAVREGAQLIISHHPVIFGGIKSVTDQDPDGETLLSAIENGISIYCAHTNLDSCPGGLTDYLCEKLNLTPLEPIEGNDGRICAPREGLRLLELCSKIKEVLNLEVVSTTAQMNRPVKRVAVCNGSGGSMAGAARAKGADVYITGDVKYHQLREFYLAENFEYIEVSHYDSEKIVTELLFDRLKERFGAGLEAVISKTNVNVMTEVW